MLFDEEKEMVGFGLCVGVSGVCLVLRRYGIFSQSSNFFRA